MGTAAQIDASQNAYRAQFEKAAPFAALCKAADAVAD